MSDQRNDSDQAPKDAIESIVYYGAVTLVLGGGAGIWIPMVMPGKTLTPDSLATYIFAILAPLLADAFLHESYWETLSKKVRMRILVGFAIAGVAALTALLRDGKAWDWCAGWFGVFASLVIWFFLIKFSKRFEPSDATPPKGSLGGDIVSPRNLGGGGLQ